MHWYDWLGGIAAGTGLGGSIWAFAWKILRRQIHSICTEVITTVVQDIKSDVEEVKLKLAKETGGNSNGLRQKLDEVGKDVATMTGVVSTL